MHSLAEAAALAIVAGKTPTTEEQVEYDALETDEQHKLRLWARDQAAREHGAAIQQNIAQYGAPAKRRFREMSVSAQSALGIRALLGRPHKVSTSHGRHRRASGAAPIRIRGSRRVATSSGQDPGDPDPEPPDELVPALARRSG